MGKDRDQKKRKIRVIKISGWQLCTRCLGWPNQTEAVWHTRQTYPCCLSSSHLLSSSLHFNFWNPGGCTLNKEVSKRQRWHPGNNRTPLRRKTSLGWQWREVWWRQMCRNLDSSAKERGSRPGISKKIGDIIDYLVSLTLWKIVLAGYWMVWEGLVVSVKAIRQMKERQLVTLRK